MAHPHPVVNFALLPGSPTGQTMRTNHFPNLGFPECTNELPLDLNFVQKLSQNSMTAQNEVEVDSSLLHQQMELDSSPGSHQDFTLKGIPELGISNGTMDGASLSKTPRSRCHWTHGEVMALFDAKKAQADKFDALNEKVIKKGGRSSNERWDEVAEHCKNLGVTKLASQCKDKWERIWPAFRKILDWERQLPPGKRSYWSMAGDEREQEGFPRVFDKELYDAMGERFGYIRTYDLSSIVVDSSFEDAGDPAAADADAAAGDVTADAAAYGAADAAAYGVADGAAYGAADVAMYGAADGAAYGAADAAAYGTPVAAMTTCSEPIQNGTHVVEESPPVVDNQVAPVSSSRKRKNIVRQIPVPLKQLTPMENKRAITGADVNDENANAKVLKDQQPKRKPVNLTDRKLSLEERKLKLAEKRLLLEEKKLDVTIEIGRGLITSMERMTSAISTLGVFSAPAH